MSAVRQATTTANIAAIRIRQARRDAQILAFRQPAAPVSTATAKRERELAQRNEMLSEALAGVGFLACLLLAGWACTDQADRFFYWLATVIT